jgi:uncharacterized RDD family membrane protein YckC
VDALPAQAYAPWIRRVAAYLIDYILVWLIAAVLVVSGGVMVAAAGNSSRLEAIVVVIVNLVVLAFAIWNWGYRQGITGSSIGKSALKFKVVSEQTGQPIGFGLSIARYFAHFLDAIIFGVGYLLPLFTAKRQTIADMIMGTVCVFSEPRPLRADTPRPKLRMAIAITLFAVAAVLTLLAVLNSTSQELCTSAGQYRHCGPQVSVGPISYPAWQIFDPYLQALFVPPLWTAAIFVVRRYYRATYLLVPVSGIVAIVVFAQGRYDWGWFHNWFAFLACVFIPTAVCVLIARRITRSRALVSASPDSPR